MTTDLVGGLRRIFKSVRILLEDNESCQRLMICIYCHFLKYLPNMPPCLGPFSTSGKPVIVIAFAGQSLTSFSGLRTLSWFTTVATQFSILIVSSPSVLTQVAQPAHFDQFISIPSLSSSILPLPFPFPFSRSPFFAAEARRVKIFDADFAECADKR